MSAVCYNMHHTHGSISATDVATTECAWQGMITFPKSVVVCRSFLWSSRAVTPGQIRGESQAEQG